MLKTKSENVSPFGQLDDKIFNFEIPALTSCQYIKLTTSFKMKNQAQQSHQSIKGFSYRQNSIHITFKQLTFEQYSPSSSTNGQINKRTILNSISGSFNSGETTAIMGPSGSGKTTLLNIVSRKIPSQNLEIYANRNSYEFQAFGTFANYVTQEDIFMPNLTVRQTLRFAADLKLNLSPEEKEARVDEMISELKLERCQNTRIGNQMMKGISGGQKRRASIAYELITDPYVVLLDEPTSGLDSLTSYVVIKYLKKLAVNRHKTVAFTIHNPNSQIFALFDRLILLSQGQTIYQGRAQNAIKYFEENFNIPCFDVQSPGEYLISQAHRLRSDKQQLKIYSDRYEKVLSKKVQKEIDLLLKGPIPMRECNISCFTLYSILVRREGTNLFKNPTFFITRFVQTVFIVIFAGGLCCNIGKRDLNDQINWHALTGFFFFLSINGLNNSLNPTSMIFPLQRNVFIKEKNSGLYGVVPYFISRNIVELPYTFIFPFLTSVIVYWFAGLNNTPQQFFTFFLIQYLLGFCGSSLGFFLGSIIVDPRTISIGLSFITLPLIVYAGFYKNTASLSKWNGWIQYLSPIKYAFGATVYNQELYAVNSNIDQLNLNVSLWESIGIMFVLAISFRLLSLLFLWIRAK